MKKANHSITETDNCIVSERNTQTLSNPDIFASQSFSQHSKIAVSLLEAYLKDNSIKGLNMINPPSLMKVAKDLMTKNRDSITPFDEERFKSIIELYISTGIQLYSPGYMGRQFSGVVPLAGVFDMVNSILNQPSSFYEAGQLPNIAERIMSYELNEFIGFDEKEFSMVSTSGGSLANLTALLAARNDKFPGVWSKGLTSMPQYGIPAIAVSQDVHYSITRAAGILGIGEDQIVHLPVNRARQICVDKVQDILDKARNKGLNIFCLVASVGTTSVGAIDPIEELAAIAEENNIWLHVDGSHGASLLLSEQFRHKLKGIEKTDSLVWDAHKMLFVPSPCSLLFYKNKEKSYGAFHQKASYVFEKHADIYSEYDGAEKNFECTKRPSIMNLWLLWAMYGKALFSEKVDSLCQLSKSAYEILEKEPDFETIHQPECNILCFRYRPQHAEGSTISDLQLHIRNQIRLDGTFFISKVDINEEAALRVVFMNHEIKMSHFEMLLDEIRKTGQIIMKTEKHQS